MKVTILVFVSLVLVYVDADILCTASYCQDYLDDNTCPDVPTKCSIQNVTHNGVFLPFPGPCNCCDYCVSNLDEEEACAIGDAASPTPTVICGDLLYCTVGDSENTCQTIDTVCTKDQARYDANRESGTLGHLELRANCDRRGLYVPYKCIPGEICYCVDEEGERIFGEIPFTVLASSIMNCECSRKYAQASAYLGRSLHNGEHLRCSSNGDYDALQCLDDSCFCVHTSDGSPALNTLTSVNITSISNETIACFDHDTHMEGEYYRECEGQVVEILAEIAEYKELGYEVFGYSFPSCQLDGFYASVQTNDTTVYCADPDGNLIDDFSIAITDTDMVTDMDCKCARARSLALSDKPDCCRNGNYNPMQCRRGLCRCVDANGNQEVQEVNFANRDSLECFESGCAKSTQPTTTTEPTTDEVNEELMFNTLTDS